MSEALSDLDMAWEQVVAARAHDDMGAEARMLSLLEQALYDEGRGAEADEVGRQMIDLARRCSDGREILHSRFEMWMRRGARLEKQAAVSESFHHGVDLYLLKAAHDAYFHALMAFNALADRPEPLREEVRQRVDAMDERIFRREDELRRSGPLAMESGPELAETVIAGFLAVKVLGPFLEEWARTLGKQFGESTVRALERIQIRHLDLIRPKGARMDGTKLEASVPGIPTPTTLVLPRPLSDSAKLAIIDLDPAEAAVRGQTLCWSESEVAWLSLQEWFTAFRNRHPEVTVSDSGQSASWSDEDGPHTVSSKSLLWMIGYLEAQFDR
jgi:hypothetical protein